MLVSSSLNGSQLRIVTRWDNLYTYDVYVTRRSNGTNSTFEVAGGYAIDILTQLSLLLNFSYIFVPEVGPYEFKKATPLEIDLFVASYSLFESRARFVDPSYVTGISRIVAIINHEFEDHGGSFLHPFPSDLWIFLAVFIVVCIICMCLIGRAEGFLASDLLVDTLATFLLKNTQLPYKNIKSFISKLLMSITAVVVVTSYSGQLVSLLSVQIYGIKDLESLLSSDLRIMLERGYNSDDSPIQAIAEALSSEVPLLKKLLEKSRDSGFVYESFEKSISEVNRDSSSAYIIDEETGVLAVTQTLGSFPCSWSAMPVAGIHYPWSMFMRKNSPFKHSINLGLLHLDQCGLLSRSRHHWIPSTTKNTLYGSVCKHSSSHSSSQNGLPFKYIREAFLFLTVVGFAFPLLSLVIEICYVKCKPSPTKANLAR